MAVCGQGAAAAPAPQSRITIADATSEPAWRAGSGAASEAALNPSSSTARAANSDQGGIVSAG